MQLPLRGEVGGRRGEVEGDHRVRWVQRQGRRGGAVRFDWGV